MAKYKEYGYDIQDGKAIIPEWETEIKDKYYIIKTIDMSNKKFMLKCIMALMLCLIGLASYGNKMPTNEIHYTTIDNSVLPIEDLFYFGEGRIVSNTYVPDKNVCILKLDKDVTEIREEPFKECNELTSITLPPSVTKIGRQAFCGCSSLTSIAIPPSVTEIVDWAFEDCSSLTSITIPESVTVIGGEAFSGCSSLTSITIPPSVTEIGWLAFNGCSSLTSITIPPSVTKIVDWAFRGCSSLKSITVSKDNKFYDSREDCNALIHTESNTLIRGCENTIIPPSVTEIGEVAFHNCSSLTSITIPESVTKIGDGAFEDCKNLTSIAIPESVTEIGKWAFEGCSSLTSITVSKENKFYDSREDCNAIIHTESNTLIRGCEKTVIPPSVTKIGGSAFKGCSSLTSITIPPSVTEIGEDAFCDCTSLTSISIPPSVKEIKGSIIGGTFSYCSSLTEVRIPKGCYVDEDAFKDSPKVKIEKY